MAGSGGGAERRRTTVKRRVWTPQPHGMVLVIVLWIVTLLAVMAGAFAYSMRVETRLATGAVERAQARALAEAGVAYALAWQRDPESQRNWPANGDWRDWRFGEHRVRISIEDAAGRINLNKADPRMLQQVLRNLGVAEGDLERLVAAIDDWRDPDDEPRPQGAESAAYQAAGRVGPKNAPFESVEELQQVLGLDPEIARRLAAQATVATRISGINPLLATVATLQAVTGLNEQALADYSAARVRTAGEGIAPPLPTVDEQQSFFSGSQSGSYHITALAETGAGTFAGVEVVATTRNPPPGQAARTLSWYPAR